MTPSMVRGLVHDVRAAGQLGTAARLDCVADTLERLYLDRDERDRMLSLVAEGGWLVSSSRCSQMEIAFARAEGRMFVDADGLGYVVRPAASFPSKTMSADATVLCDAIQAVVDARKAEYEAATEEGFNMGRIHVASEAFNHALDFQESLLREVEKRGLPTDAMSAEQKGNE